jgi:Fe2+ transport system protein FeoA
MVPLNELEVGEKGVVKSLTGGRGIISRLAALGFTPNAEVNIIQNFGHGPLIVAVHDVHIALGRGEASKIRVIKKGTA